MKLKGKVEEITIDSKFEIIHKDMSRSRREIGSNISIDPMF